MGAIGGLFGSAGGASGTGFAAPKMPDIVNPVTQQQISNSYAGVQSGLSEQQKLLQALQGQQGIANQAQVYSQLQDIAAGRGPNPAQAMLNQQTGQNVANQAALMAGQRGASANVGLLARQAAQQGAQAQQNAIGQGAALQAQQSLNAINNAGGLATQQVGQQLGATQGLTDAQLREQQALLNAQQGYNEAITGAQGNVNQANAGLAQTTMKGQQGVIGGIFNSVGSLFADGGVVTEAPKKMAPLSKMGKYIASANAPTEDSIYQGVSNFGTALVNKIKGSPDMVAKTGEANYIGDTPMNSTEKMFAAMGGNVGHKLKKGGKVPGKAPVAGAVNSYKNDVVDAKLSPGEIVLPNSITKGPNPVGDAAKFVAALLSKKGK